MPESIKYNLSVQKQWSWYMPYSIVMMSRTGTKAFRQAYPMHQNR
jgi:hypothetical protein